MAVYKNKSNNTWYVSVYYKNWQGSTDRKVKRGFKTKREASEWERTFLLQRSDDVDMTFGAFWELYKADLKEKIRDNTWNTKVSIVDKKILPYFKDRKLNEIKPTDIMAWHNEMMGNKDKNGKPFSKTYLKTIHNQISAIFNHAVRYYDLKVNPAAKVGNMGKDQTKEMKFWTKAEYLKFAEAMMDKSASYYAFEMLYWCGLRLGDDDDKIRLNQRKPSKYKGLSRFGPEKNLQRINKFMKERPTFYKKLIQMKENFRFYLRCFYCITKVVILQFNSEKQDRISS